MSYVGFDDGGYGNYLTLSCGSENWRMAHFESISVSQGVSVSQGDLIARQGSSGNSTGPHIHAEILYADGHRIADRSITKPIVERYLAYVQ